MIGLIIYIIVACLPAWIAQNKGKQFAPWFVYALLLWPIAAIHALLLPRALTACPRCAETIKKAALVCKHCGSAVTPAIDMPAPSKPKKLSSHRPCPFCGEKIEREAKKCHHCEMTVKGVEV